MSYQTIDPTTGETLETVAVIDDDELERRVAAADDAVAALGGTSFDQRAGWMHKTADLLDAEVDEVATTMTTEMGKTLAAARAEVGKCATAMRFYADRAEQFLADQHADADTVDARHAYVTWQPLGTVLAIMPWNFPLWQAVRFAAPALMAGNTGLLKHASSVPRTARYLGAVFARGGFPDGAFQNLFIATDQVPDLLADPRVKAATLTGSERAGRAVASAAGEHVKPTVLELGGSDPFVVMPSADLDRAAQVATTARCQNNGQSCIAAKRFIVHDDVYDAFAERFVSAMAGQTVGDPTDDDTDIGPLASEQGRADVEALVADAVDKGATVLTGGQRPDRPGWWYPPTVVADVTPEMDMHTQEVFGPVASLYRVADYDEAIAVANTTMFGLGSNAWTNEADEQQAFVRDLDAGAVFINGMTASFPQLPFGGVKNSGYGRELADLGIKEFCNAKTVWIGGPDPT